jgi:triphosphoribosyl-dephospho-CoA synthase
MTVLAPRLAEPLSDAIAHQVASMAAGALRAELDTWPKPGLVSHVDRGSHTDMDAATFLASATAIEPFFAALVIAGATGAGMDALRAIGLEAEGAMLAATGGVNTHRGAIFGLGLLCAAAGAASAARLPWGASTLCRTVRLCWGQAITRGPIPLRSHGTAALLQYGAGGARAQAAAGFPHAQKIGLPALRLMPGDANAARVQSFFALLATVEDTNLLHRGGTEGLRFAQQAAAGFLAAGGVAQPDWREAAAAIHHAFVARNLSPGGCADLLAITLFLDALERHA